MNMTTQKIYAKSFWHSFCQKLTENIGEIQNNWEKPSEFTKSILKDICNKVLKEVDFEDKHQYEYLKIDLIGWNQLDDDLGDLPRNFNRHLWSFDVAIEHENDKSDWMDEVIKLSYINCPLRIVIGYAPKNCRQDYLDYVSKALHVLNDRYQCIRDKQEFLLILGDSDRDGSRISAENYTPYLYDPEKGFQDKKDCWNNKENGYVI